MKKIHVLIAFFAITVFAQQQEMSQEDSRNSSVYLHPGGLIMSLYSLAEKPTTLWFNLTGEMPLNGRYALIVFPIFGLQLEVKEETKDYPKVPKVFVIGSGIGIRRFVNGNSDGLYLQLMPNVVYLKEENSENLSASGLSTDILGYIGYSIKYSKIHCFFDFGIGYGFTHFFSVDKELIEKDPNVRFGGGGGGTKNGLSLDINIGVGIPLL